MDNETAVQIATLVTTTIIAIFTAWITYKTKQLEWAQKKIEKTANDTHHLVNYQSLLLARQHEVTARSLARITGLEEDISQAKTATRLRQEAEEKQASLANR